MFDYNLYEKSLKTQQFGRHLKYFQSIPSTNEQAKVYAKNDFKHGYALITKNQHSGKGRRSNIWFAVPNKSLTFSIMVNQKELNNKEIIPLILGLSIIDTIKDYTNINCQLKWPNDIILNQKKIGGILIEKINDILIIGIGINVNENIKDLNKNIKNASTSLNIFGSIKIELEILFAYILNNLENYFYTKKIDFVNEWNKHCCHINKEIKFHNNNRYESGLFKGVNSNGEGIVHINDKIELISSGMINL